jgi:hypothetical protein
MYFNLRGRVFACGNAQFDRSALRLLRSAKCVLAPREAPDEMTVFLNDGKFDASNVDYSAAGMEFSRRGRWLRFFVSGCAGFIGSFEGSSLA